VRRVVPARKGPVRRQLGLRLVEVRPAHHGRHLANEEPGVGGPRHGRAARAPDRVRRRAAVGGRAAARAPGVDLPRVGRVAQDAADRGARPPRRAGRRGHASRIEARGEPRQRGARLAVHGGQLGHHGGLGRVENHAPRIARAVRARAVAIGWARPGQQAAGAQPGEPAAAHPLGDERPLVLRHRAADLQQQVAVRVVAHRPVEELCGAGGPRPLLEEHHPVHVVAREAVGRCDEHPVDLAALDGVAQAVGPGRANAAPPWPSSRNTWAGSSVQPPAARSPAHGRSAARSAAQRSGGRPGGRSRRGRRSPRAWDISGGIGGAGASAGASAGAGGCVAAHRRRSP
jgi:hypothetical protein